jgi:hypothetical protein
MYSPIKADQWSSGQILLYLLRKEDTVLRSAARLTAHNPEQRPSMLQVATSLSDVGKRSCREEGLAICARHNGSRRRNLEALEGEEAETFGVRLQ